MKGHLVCARLLESDNHQFSELLLSRICVKPRGSKDFLSMFNYLLQTNKFDVNGKIPHFNNTCLHYVCSMSQTEYKHVRQRQSSTVNPNEYEQMQSILLRALVDRGANPNESNGRNERPISLCIEHHNLIGIKMLMNEIPFDIEPTNKYNHYIFYLTNIACSGKVEMQYVYNKIKSTSDQLLKAKLSGREYYGFEFLVYLIKEFTQSVHKNFYRNYLSALGGISTEGLTGDQNERSCQATIQAYYHYLEQQEWLIKLVSKLVEVGCNPNAIVLEPRLDDQQENYRKWGIPHFLMRFPSPKLLKFFMRWLDISYNSPNSQGRAPLHLFCLWNTEDNIFIDKRNPNCPVRKHNLTEMKDFKGLKSLTILLENGCNSNVLDINRSTPLLYAAMNGQLGFVKHLRSYDSCINNNNQLNQVPLLEILKIKEKFSVEQIQSVIRDCEASPLYEDIDQRISLHHLVANAVNFDTSAQLCHKLLNYHADINAKDKYLRSPIFYCFIKVNRDMVQRDHTTYQINSASILSTSGDKLQILQTLLSYPHINLNIADKFGKSPLHYACEGNFFFSILYMLNKGMRYDEPDAQGNTPLAICLRNKRINQAALIIRKGVKYGYVHDHGQAVPYFKYAVLNKLSVGFCFLLIDFGYPLVKALEEVQSEFFKEILLKKYGRL